MGGFVLFGSGGGSGGGGGVTSWKDAVANKAALPASGNTTGDARIALDTAIPYVWSGSAWKTLGIGYDPSMEGSLLEWFDVTNAASMGSPSNGAKVSSILGQCGHYTLQQLTAANQLTYSTTGLNGGPGLLGNGSTTYMKSTVNSSITGDPELTYIIVMKPSSTTVDQPLCGFGDSSASGNGFGTYLVANSYYGIEMGSGNTYKGNQLTTTNPVVMTVRKVSGPLNTSTTIRINGVTLGTQTASTTTPSIAAAPLSYGLWNNYTAAVFNGYIGSWCIFNKTLTTSAMARVENYLNAAHKGIF
jgi:hypothetical protein